MILFQVVIPVDCLFLFFGESITVAIVEKSFAMTALLLDNQFLNSIFFTPVRVCESCDEVLRVENSVEGDDQKSTFEVSQSFLQPPQRIKLPRSRSVGEDLSKMTGSWEVL